jgi:hypothetical protein
VIGDLLPWVTLLPRVSAVDVGALDDASLAQALTTKVNAYSFDELIQLLPPTVGGI